MFENIIALRARNARLERGLVSAPARRTICRIRTELAHRGLTTVQRETVLHDSLLMLAECEAAGGDPLELLLGTTDVSAYEAAVTSFCDEVTAECPRLSVALTIVRFCALLVVALGVVLAAHLVFRLLNKPPGGWLPWYEVNLRAQDSTMLDFEFKVVPIIFLLVQILSSLLRKNPWPHALPAMATPVVFAVFLAGLTAVGVVMLPGGIALYNPLMPEVIAEAFVRWPVSGDYPHSFFATPFTIPFYSSDTPWVNANVIVLFMGAALLIAAALGVVYLIESHSSRES